MKRSPSPKGFRVSLGELAALGVPAKVGAQFESDRLELHRAVFEVIKVTPNGVVLVRHRDCDE